MDKPFFSIVLPVYNAIKYVETTLQSLLQQSFDNYEIIIVNDGSTDGSDGICNNYSQLYEQIRYYEKENGGICNARNFALEKVKGKYILFCDHDDVFIFDKLPFLYLILKEENYDVLKLSYQSEVFQKDRKVKEYRTVCKKWDCFTEDLRDDYAQFNAFTFTVWNGVYKTDMVKRLGLRFDERIRYGMEDVMFNLTLLQQNIRIGFISDLLYIHYIRYGQSKSREFDQNKLDSICRTIALENDFLGMNKSKAICIQQMGKYIRSYFVALRMSEEWMGLGRIKNSLGEFRGLINYRIGIYDSVKHIQRYKKDFVKIILFKFHCYRLLIVLLRGQ